MQKIIVISHNLRKACPKLILGTIQCKVTNSLYSAELWSEILATGSNMRSTQKIEHIKNIPTVWYTREAYKQCGKDPNRYRPSAEQLNRRVLQGKDLHQISTLVDLINLVSLKWGYSIGGFDLDKVQGNLCYGIGQPNEAYNGIGRGALNIEGLPVLRDELGGIGTPTSDEERTMIHLETTSLLMNINAFDGNREALLAVINQSSELLIKYVGAENLTVCLFP